MTLRQKATVVEKQDVSVKEAKKRSKKIDNMDAHGMPKKAVRKVAAESIKVSEEPKATFKRKQSAKNATKQSGTRGEPQKKAVKLSTPKPESKAPTKITKSKGDLEFPALAF